MKTISDYNNDLENYKNVYMEYLLAEDHQEKKEELSVAFMKLKLTTDEIKSQIRKNKKEILEVTDENIKEQNDINVLGKMVYKKGDLTVQDKAKISKLIEGQIYGSLNSDEILDNKVKNSKLIKDLEEYISKKHHTIVILSIINAILVLIIVVFLYLIISKKYLKMKIFTAKSNNNNNMNK